MLTPICRDVAGRYISQMLAGIMATDGLYVDEDKSSTPMLDS